MTSDMVPYAEQVKGCENPVKQIKVLLDNYCCGTIDFNYQYVIDPVIAYSLLINRLTKGTRDVICKIIELSARATLIY